MSHVILNLNVVVGLGPIVPDEQQCGLLTHDQQRLSHGEDLLRPNGSVLTWHDIPPALPASSPPAGARSSHRPHRSGPGVLQCSPAAGSDNSMPEEELLQSH